MPEIDTQALLDRAKTAVRNRPTRAEIASRLAAAGEEIAERGRIVREEVGPDLQDAVRELGEHARDALYWVGELGSDLKKTIVTEYTAQRARVAERLSEGCDDAQSPRGNGSPCAADAVDVLRREADRLDAAGTAQKVGRLGPDHRLADQGLGGRNVSATPDQLRLAAAIAEQLIARAFDPVSS